MAFTVSNVKKFNLNGDTPALVMLVGTGTATGVTTGILEGTDYGIREIASYSASLESGTGISAMVKTYDHATYDADIVTVTCTAGDVFHFQLIGMDNGA